MNKNYFGIIFAIMILCAMGTGYAAVGVGSWVENNGVNLDITVGETAEFRYGITAVEGTYSIKLYREGNNMPLTIYADNVPTVGNSAMGRYNVTPQDYQNLQGQYYILITSIDMFGSDTFRLNLNVEPQTIEPLTISCTASPQTGNSPLSVILYSTVTGTGPYTYTTIFGDGQSTTSTSTNTQMSWTHIYNAGTYNPIISVTNTNGQTATATCGTIIVTEPIINNLTAVCTVTPTAGTSPLQATFNCITSGGTTPYTYNWIFGDGTTINNNQNNIIHTYITGTYHPLVIISDNNGNSITKILETIIVTNPIINNLTATCNAIPTSGTAPLNVQFTSQVSGGSGTYNYAWTFGDGTTSNTPQNILHTYTNQGTYSPILIVTDTNNNVVQANCGKIIVTEPIINNLTAVCTVTPTAGTSPLQVTFNCITSGGTTPYNYYWIYDDGTTINTNQNTITHIYTEGVYNPKVIITDKNQNSITKTLETITVKSPIINNLTVVCSAEPTSGYAPLEVQFKSKATGGSGTYTYVWKYNDGTIGIGYTQETTHIYQNQGTYNPTITVKDTQGNTATTNCGTIKVTKPETNNLTAICKAEPTTGTAPLNVQFESQVLGGSGEYKYIWVFDDGQNSTNQQNTQHTYNNQGTYYPKLAVIDIQNNNKIITNCGTIKVTKPAVNNLTITCSIDPTEGTAPLETTLKAKLNIQAETTTQYTYTINNDDGTNQIIPQTPNTQITTTHTYQNQGTYNPTITVKDTQGNTATTNCGTIKVTKPAVNNLTVVCSAEPTSGYAPLEVQFKSKATGGSGTYTYVWKYNDGTIGIGYTQETTHIYQNQGTYNPTITVKDTQGNTATTNCGTIKVTKPTVNNLTITCSIDPTEGTAPLETTLKAKLNIQAETTTQYTYTINNDDGTNQIIPQTPNTQITTTHTYQNQGTYNPTITVKDTQGNTATTNCGTIKVNNNSTPNSLLANPGGPYFGYINEQVLFDGSLSVGQITMYVWDFGDGAIISTISPNVAHIYDNVGRYVVTLTVYDSNGNSNTAKTTATIIERSSPINNIIKDLPDRGLLVNHLIIYGIDGEIIRSNDDITTQIEVKNVGKTKLKNVRITISIPELGYESRSTLFDLNRGQEHDESIILPVYNVPKGIYYVRILIENDDGNTQVKRIKYREIIVDEVNTKTCCSNTLFT